MTEVEFQCCSYIAACRVNVVVRVIRRSHPCLPLRNAEFTPQTSTSRTANISLCPSTIPVMSDPALDVEDEDDESGAQSYKNSELWRRLHTDTSPESAADDDGDDGTEAGEEQKPKVAEEEEKGVRDTRKRKRKTIDTPVEIPPKRTRPRKRRGVDDAEKADEDEEAVVEPTPPVKAKRKKKEDKIPEVLEVEKEKPKRRAHQTSIQCQFLDKDKMEGGQATDLPHCKQRAILGLKFCIRHVLLDPNAPYLQCAHDKLKKTKKEQGVTRCTNAIHKDRGEIYCNTHMIMMGLKERKNPKRPSIDALSMDSFGGDQTQPLTPNSIASPAMLSPGGPLSIGSNVSTPPVSGSQLISPRPMGMGHAGMVAHGSPHMMSSQHHMAGSSGSSHHQLGNTGSNITHHSLQQHATAQHTPMNANTSYSQPNSSSAMVTSVPLGALGLPTTSISSNSGANQSSYTVSYSPMQSEMSSPHKTSVDHQFAVPYLPTTSSGTSSTTSTYIQTHPLPALDGTSPVTESNSNMPSRTPSAYVQQSPLPEHGTNVAYQQSRQDQAANLNMRQSYPNQGRYQSGATPPGLSQQQQQPRSSALPVTSQTHGPRQYGVQGPSSYQQDHYALSQYSQVYQQQVPERSQSQPVNPDTGMPLQAHSDNMPSSPVSMRGPNSGTLPLQVVAKHAVVNSVQKNSPPSLPSVSQLLSPLGPQGPAPLPSMNSVFGMMSSPHSPHQIASPLASSNNAHSAPGSVINQSAPISPFAQSVAPCLPGETHGMRIVDSPRADLYEKESMSGRSSSGETGKPLSVNSQSAPGSIQSTDGGEKNQAGATITSVPIGGTNGARPLSNGDAQQQHSATIRVYRTAAANTQRSGSSDGSRSVGSAFMSRGSRPADGRLPTAIVETRPIGSAGSNSSGEAGVFMEKAELEQQRMADEVIERKQRELMRIGGLPSISQMNQLPPLQQRAPAASRSGAAQHSSAPSASHSNHQPHNEVCRPVQRTMSEQLPSTSIAAFGPPRGPPASSSHSQQAIGKSLVQTNPVLASKLLGSNEPVFIEPNQHMMIPSTSSGVSASPDPELVRKNSSASVHHEQNVLDSQRAELVALRRQIQHERAELIRLSRRQATMIATVRRLPERQSRLVDQLTHGANLHSALRRCCHVENKRRCSAICVPLSVHCKLHVMENKSQRMWQYCQQTGCLGTLPQTETRLWEGRCAKHRRHMKPKNAAPSTMLASVVASEEVEMVQNMVVEYGLVDRQSTSNGAVATLPTVRRIPANSAAGNSQQQRHSFNHHPRQQQPAPVVLGGAPPSDAPTTNGHKELIQMRNGVSLSNGLNRVRAMEVNADVQATSPAAKVLIMGTSSSSSDELTDPAAVGMYGDELDSIMQYIQADGYRPSATHSGPL